MKVSCLTDDFFFILARIKDKYYQYYRVEINNDGFWFVPDKPRYEGDIGDFIGKELQQAKTNLSNIVDIINSK